MDQNWTATQKVSKLITVFQKKKIQALRNAEKSISLQPTNVYKAMIQEYQIIDYHVISTNKINGK